MPGSQSSHNKSQQLPPGLAVMEMLNGYTITQSIFVAAKLKLADELGDSEMTAEELAKKTSTHAPSLYRLLRALASKGLFQENAQKQFRLTEEGKTLHSNHPQSTRSAALLFGESWHWRPWGELLYSVRTGKPAFDHVLGKSIFEYFSKHPEANEEFNGAMATFTSMEAPAVTAAYNFSGLKKVVDIAGGVGGLLISILKANPHLHGVLFDLPYVAEEARNHIRQAELTDRAEVISGDFFKKVPPGADAYIMKSIIHDWDDARALTILKNCHQAMEKNGKLLLAERVIPPGNEPFFGKFLDLEMLVMTQGGKERTEEEYKALFAQAGFRLTGIFPTPTPLSVIEAVRI